MTSTSADNRGSPSTTEKDTKNGATEKIETTQDDVENRDEGQASVNNIEEAADISDNDDGKIVYVALPVFSIRTFFLY